MQGAATFEKSTLEAVVQARASVGSIDTGKLPDHPEAFARFQQAQDALSSALSRLLVVVERYPDIKANQNFRDLQGQLEGTENRVSVERMRFNEKAQEYNTARLRMPNGLFAGMLGFREKAYFKAVAGSEQPPAVNFNFGASPAPAESGSRLAVVRARFRALVAVFQRLGMTATAERNGVLIFLAPVSRDE